MAGGSKPPVTPVLGDSIPSSILWLSGAQVLTIHTDIHIIKNNNKNHFKTSNEKKSKNKNNNKQPDRFEKEVLQTCSCLWWVSGGGRGGSKQRGWRLSSGCPASRLPVSLCSVCFQSHSDQSGPEPPQPFPKEPTTLQAGPASRAGCPHQVPCPSQEVILNSSMNLMRLPQPRLMLFI